MAHYENALSFCRKVGYRPEWAWTCCDYTDALRERGSDGDREKAITLLGDSQTVVTQYPLQAAIYLPTLGV